MADSVTVDHGGLTVTTNTASEADLRAELTRDDAPAAPASSDAPAADDAPAAPVRDDKGRFLKREGAAEPVAPPPPADAAAAPPADSAETARTRDPSLP